MKTISLDDEAYHRLLCWKQSKGDSFSKVVKRVVPEADSLGSQLDFVVQRTPKDERDTILEDSVEDRSPSKNDPWT